MVFGFIRKIIGGLWSLFCYFIMAIGVIFILVGIPLFLIHPGYGILSFIIGLLIIGFGKFLLWLKKPIGAGLDYLANMVGRKSLDDVAKEIGVKDPEKAREQIYLGKEQGKIKARFDMQTGEVVFGEDAPKYQPAPNFVECEYCGTLYPPEAIFCPNCGAPNKRRK